MFQGIFTALVTPFSSDAFDEDAFTALVNWQISEGIHGLVPVGTTGESPTLTHEEHARVIELCVEVTAGRVPVMAGTGSNCTREAILRTQHAGEAGADSVLIVAPYYNKPTQEGIYQHYKAVHDATDIPLVIYNVPGRSIINITDETLARLAALPRIIGLKDATGDLARVSTLRAEIGKAFLQFSGEDMTAVAFNAAGGVGCISVLSNIAPQLCAQIQTATLKGNFIEAREMADKLTRLTQVLFAEANPVPVKYALSLMGKCKADVRLPLVELSVDTKKRVEAALKNAHII